MSKHIQHKRAFLIGLAIYPLVTILFWLLGNYLTTYPLAVRAIILIVIAVPIAACLILPFYNKIFIKWLSQ